MVNALLSATWATCADEWRHRAGGLAKSSRRSICAPKPPHPSNMLNHEQTAEETARLALPCQIPVNIYLVGLQTADMQLLVGPPGRASEERMAIR